MTVVWGEPPLAVSLPEPRVDRLTAADVPAVHRICVDSFSAPWTPSVLYRELERPFGRSWVVRQPTVAAFVSIWQVRDEVHVLNLATAQSARRLGYGRLLMDQVLDHAKVSAVSYISLEVDVENSPATRLYRSLGFETIGIRPGYYDGRDAAVMLRSLPG